MSTRNCIVVLLALTLISGMACAGTYEIRIPAAERSYSWTESAEFDVDLGTTFSSINAVRLDWSASVYPGETELIGVGKIIDDWVLNLGASWGAGTGGSYTQTSNEEFGWHQSPTIPGPYDGLLGGQAHVTVGVQPVHENYFAVGHADVTDLYLIVNGTPVVPEPSSLMALAGGLASLGGLIRRKK